MANLSKSIAKMVKHMDDNWMFGCTPSSLKKTPGLWPMYFIMSVGVLWCIGFSTRTFFFNPDGLNPITGKPNWERYRDGRNFKLFNFAGVTIPCQAPEYRQPGDPDDDSYAVTKIGWK